MKIFDLLLDRLPSYRSTLGLVTLAALALAGLAYVEQTPRQIAHPRVAEMVAATEMTRLGARHLRAVGEGMNVLTDSHNDPEGSGLIGLKNSELTSLPGRLESKQASLNPHFAALAVRLLHEAGVGEGDVVAVGVSGSFPGLNLALFSALESMRTKPLIVTSVASSSWGANRPIFTWLDMEKALDDVGILSLRSRAASIGADDDLGSGLTERGRDFALAAIRRTGAEAIRGADLEASVTRRLELIRDAGMPKAYINVGGGAASLAVADELARSLPVIHLREVRDLAALYDLPVPDAQAGLGGLYVRQRYDVALAGAILVSLSLLLALLSHHDRKRNSLEARARQLEHGGAENPEPKRSTRPITKPILVTGSRWGLFLLLALVLAAPGAEAADFELPGLEPLEVKVDGRVRTYFHLAPGERVRVEFTGSGVMEVLGRVLIGSQSDRSTRLLYRVDGGDLHTTQWHAKEAPGAFLVSRAGELSSLQKARVAVGPGRHVLELRLRGGRAAAIRVRLAALKDGERVAVSRRPARWSSQIRAGSWYDSNILRYSQKYIDRFENGSEPGRFQVESLDDVVTRLDLRLHRSFRGFGGRGARVHVSAAAHAYAENEIKNWNRVELGWRQDLGAGFRLDLRASAVPDFYLRHQRDIDLQGITARGVAPSFDAFSFSTGALDLAVRKRFSRALSLRFETRWATHDYIEGYDEFDDEQWRVGLRVDHQPSRSWSWAARYRYTRSDARGYDQPGETRALSDDADASYEQHGVELFASRSWAEKELRLEASAADRQFLTTKSPTIVPLYAGREDLRWRVGTFVDFPLRSESDLEGTIYVEWQQRTARSSISSFDLAREKDYELVIAGFRLAFRR